MRQLVVTAKGWRLLRRQRRTLRVAFAADPLPRAFGVPPRISDGWNWKWPMCGL